MERLDLLAAENNLLHVIARCFQQASEAPSARTPPFFQVNAHLHRIKPACEPRLSAQTLPVCRYLRQTLQAPGADRALVQALEPLLPLLAWIQNPNYQKGVMPAGFLENYGYADIVSQRGLIADDEFALGILLLGPHTEYPPHHHPAEEIYYTLGGWAEWWQTGQTWLARSAGSFVYHPSGVVHAMRTGAEPVCLLYAWWGDVQTAAQLTGDRNT
ncbi:MAG: dimethylsulfonioproprionate lyase family protein [Caldilineaceae bacterium]